LHRVSIRGSPSPKQQLTRPLGNETGAVRQRQTKKPLRDLPWMENVPGQKRHDRRRAGASRTAIRGSPLRRSLRAPCRAAREPRQCAGLRRQAADRRCSFWRFSSIAEEERTLHQRVERAHFQFQFDSSTGAPGTITPDLNFDLRLPDGSAGIPITVHFDGYSVFFANAEPSSFINANGSADRCGSP